MTGKITIALIAATIAFVIGVRMIANRAPRPDRLGVVGGKLQACPETPNCASSYEGLLPYTYSGDTGAARSALVDVLQDWPRTTIVREDTDYLHVEFRSRVFNFIDDGEFYFPEEGSVIHYRSAARTGHSDLGANEQRMAAIGEALTESLDEREGAE